MAVKLTREQHAAVRSDARVLVLHAGAGSGKTLTLAQRVARFTAHDARAQSRTLVVTFTRDAAESLRRKLAMLLGRQHFVRVQTFHQWAARELPQGSRRFLSEEERRRILGDLLRRAPVTLARSLGDEPIAKLASVLGWARNREATIEAALAGPFAPLAHHADALAAIDEGYAQRKGDALDYDDVPLALRDLLRRPTARREIAARLDHVLVDEFQDVNAAQATSIRMLAETRGGPDVTLVGDPRQAIYAFRGSSPHHLLAFHEPFGRSAEVRALATNFRSTRRLVQAANALHPGAAPMRASRAARLGVGARLEVLDDGAQEARRACDIIEAWIAKGADPAETAVLVRARHLAHAYGDEVRRRALPAAPAARTIHAAKGLEWDRVLLLGAREGGLPGDHALRAPEAAREELLEEERRLAYVALTRARREFVATSAGPRVSRFFSRLEVGHAPRSSGPARSALPASFPSASGRSSSSAPSR